MKRLVFMFKGLLLATTLMLSGCDKIAGVAIEGANNAGKAIGGAVKAVQGDGRDIAEAVCTREAAARYPGRSVYTFNISLEGYDKYLVILHSELTPEEEVKRKERIRRKTVDGQSRHMAEIYDPHNPNIHCNTDNGVVTSIKSL